jgi:hypothetical protein
MIESREDLAPHLSGATINPVTETSSLMGDNESNAMTPPNFISDCFFLCHILISYMAKKLEQFYMQNNEELNKSISEKNYPQFDELMAQKVCMDAHVFGKHIIALYRQLFGFTNALLIC